jgi:hypothetical protein
LSDIGKNPLGMVPTEFEAHIRLIISLFESNVDQARAFIGEHPGIRNWWRTREARLEAWRSRRSLDRLKFSPYILPSHLVRQVFQNGGWVVRDCDGLLFVNGLRVHPVPPLVLADQVKILELRRTLNIVPEYDRG